MSFTSPAYGIILPFLFLFTVPIFLLATATTFLAFSLLLFRVVLIYIELALAVIPHYLSLLLLTPKASSKPTSLPRERSFASSSTRRKRRRGSSASVTGTITPISAGSGMGLSQSVGATRDFEGVGGWRLGGDEDDDDALWTSINSRLELPADHSRRHHRRSVTSGSMDVLAMNTSRTRSPPRSAGFGEGYFPPTTPKSMALKRNSSNTTGSSGSSKSSSALGMKGR